MDRMSYHFLMGAINKYTDRYEYPKIASKQQKYKCPCCHHDVIFKHGKIKQPHFSHYKSDHPCYYYDKPSESQLHKDAKLLMKSLLDDKKQISIHKRCNCGYKKCTQICYNENTTAVIEHRFYYNDSHRSADVALIEPTKITYIFEICYKNKTREENRPEPWVELNAQEFIRHINSVTSNDGIHVDCIRQYKCDACIYHEQKYKDYLLEEEEKKRRDHERRQQELMKQREEYEQRQQEMMKQKREQEELQRQHILKMQQKCKCTIPMINICKCETPRYELIKISNNLLCINCSKWKCRC